MVVLVEPEDIVNRLPRPLEPFERERLPHLIEDAVEEITAEFLMDDRDFEAELRRYRWLPHIARKVIREMVSAAILIGPAVGMRSVSSNTGPQADSATFADVESVSWDGVRLTDGQRKRLGLPTSAMPRGRFPAPLAWPEEVHVHGGGR